MPLADNAVTVDAILKERKNELAFEGHLLHDKKRTRANVVTTTETIPFNANKLVFPIPEREVIVNPNLGQNPGY
jgi:starch-binding outer membrane protein, SusD/RagB family